MSKHQKKSRAIFQDLTAGEKDFWIVYLKPPKNFEIIMLFGHLTKNLASKCQGLWLLCSRSEKSHVDPAIQVPPIPKTMFFMGLGNSTKHQIFSATFLVGYPKNIISKFSVVPFAMPVPNHPFPEMKIREERNCLSLSFGNEKKLVQPIYVGAIESTKNGVICP